MERIRIDLLRINSFRNYEILNCSFHKHINVITGLNGAGKTSILDAIYYLSNGKSYFTHLDSVLYKKGDSFFNLKGEMYVEDERFPLMIKSSSKGKEIKVDDKIIKSITEYYGRFPSYMIAPKDILILVESSIERRKLIDKTLSQVDKVYFNHLITYNKLLKQRNIALKSFLKNKKADKLLIEALNVKMYGPSKYIYEKRKSYVENIMPIVNKFYNLISTERENVNIEYKTKLHNQSLEYLFVESAARDYIMGKTHEGNHRDDLSIKLNGNDIRKFGSQGQLKSAIIAIKLAQIEWVKSQTGCIPILLLDDIFDKLDKERVFTFVKLCAEELEAQVFITDTDADRVVKTLDELKLNYRHFVVEEGKLKD